MNELMSAVDALAAEDLGGAGTADLGADLVALSRAVARLEAEFARRLREFDRRDGARADALPTAAWLRHRCRLTPAAASMRLTVARRLTEFPSTAAAFAAGELSLDHVRAITLVRDDTARAAVAAAETVIVEHAMARPPGETARLVAHVVHAAAPEALADQAESAYERRWLSLSETLDGMYAIDGMLDRETGVTVRTALHALVARDRRPGDSRSPAQARVDALGALARQTLDAGDLPDTSGERPHLNVLVDLATLEGRSGTRAATLDWSGAIPGETARRLACDAQVSRVVTQGASQPLDIGRASRVVPSAIRRALDVRDRGCVWPGCDRPPPWTDAHHVVHWADGGATSLDNLVLLCRRHHRSVHEGRAPCPVPSVRPASGPAPPGPDPPSLAEVG